MNVAQFFVEKRHIAWVAMVATVIWGTVAYLQMPQRKDPEVVIKTAVVTAAWPGATAEDVESLITKPIEQVAAQVPRVDKVTSTTRAGIATVFVTLEDTAKRSDLDPAWSDLRARLELLERSLPPGARPPQLNTNFGDTATLTLSVASPARDELEVEVRASKIAEALKAQRATSGGGERMSTVFIPVEGVSERTISTSAQRYLSLGTSTGALARAAILQRPGFVAIDYQATDAGRIEALNDRFQQEIRGGERLHPDLWGPIVVGELAELPAALRAAAPDKYSYAQLDEYTTLIRDELARLPAVARVDRHGVVGERVYLHYSQERLASFGIAPKQIVESLRARNVSLPAATVGTGKQLVQVDASLPFASTQELLATPIASNREGGAIHLRDVVEVTRTYETPSPDASWLTWKDGDTWRQTRSIAVAIQAKRGVQVTALGDQVEHKLEELERRLPADLQFVKTSDQPELVEEKIGEFMRSLVEAILIVIAISLVFMERRSAILVAASIPLTLAMTFGFMQLLGMDLQQVSIASLIIALGLLVDDPVIASDAINREMAAGVPRERAAWLGPTKLAKAILFATITNIVAFAPLLLVTGTMGEFIYSLPVVVSLALLSSRIVSMTFMPLLGYYLLKGQKGYEAALEGSGKAANFARKYNAITEWMLDHKAKSFLAFLVFLIVGLAPAALIRTQFFPEEAMSRFYIHVRLPEGSDVRATQAVADAARAQILATEGERLHRITSFVGNGGPRWWSNVSPEPKNPAYALMILEAKVPEETMPMIGRLQHGLNSKVPGARFEVYRISSGRPAVTPVEVRISGEDEATLRRLALRTKALMRELPQTADVTDDWGAEILKLDVKIDDARASAAGITHTDVANTALLALSGQPVTQLRDGDDLVDVVLRLRPSERASAASVRDLYVWGARTGRAHSIEQVAKVQHALEPQKLVRYNRERTITVGAIPKDGELPSVLLSSLKPALAEGLHLPPGYHLEFGGEHEQQAKAFAAVSIALRVSVLLIFLVLVWQFAHFWKPFIVFAAIPFGLVGAVLGLTTTHTNFGFMAFLGVASLIGVIVSHIIVLFDFIEEAREHGVPLHRAVIDAGLVRLRPVLVTVLATVGGLIPLAMNGGPMWRQLVYVQIGGLLLATVVTKGVVPLLYVVFVEQFKLIDWRPTNHGAPHQEPGEKPLAQAEPSQTAA